MGGTKTVPFVVAEFGKFRVVCIVNKPRSTRPGDFGVAEYIVERNIPDAMGGRRG